METNHALLIENLLNKTDHLTEKARRFKGLSNAQLIHKTNATNWNMLECMEHLNLYGDYYLPEIEKQINDSKHRAGSTFSSGWLGDYFVKLMQVENGSSKKMKSPKDKNPIGKGLDIITIERFLKQQKKLKHLLQESLSISLNKTKVPISIAPFIKLRLGDTFRFLIAHIERHLMQAEKLMK